MKLWKYVKAIGPASAVSILYLLCSVNGVEAGALPLLDWKGEGKVDWSSGFIISYGDGKAPAHISNRALRRQASQKTAYREATRNLLSLCLDLRVQGRLSVRDYFRDDIELQETLRETLQKLPPWEIKIGRGEETRLAIRFPLGGKGGLSELLGDLSDDYESFGAGVFQEPSVPAPEGIRSATGMVLVASRQHAMPALRPRILSEGGTVLLDYENSPSKTRDRPAFIAYYNSIEEALEDPVVGEKPIVVTVGRRGDVGTDIVLPVFLEESLLQTREGRELLTGLRIVVVLQ